MAHIHQVPGQVDHTAEVFIINNHRILLRKHDKYGIWLSVGGHIELDEDPNQAVIREAKEEVGLDIELIKPEEFVDFEEEGYKELLPPVFVNRVRINSEHEHVTYSYFATSKNNAVRPENKNDTWQWFTKDEVEASTELLPRVKRYALAALTI